ADARAAGTQAGRDRAAHELRSALRTLRATIDSFGHADIARFFGAAAADANVLDPMLLSSVDAAATLLASSRLAPAELASRLAELSRGHTVDRAIGAGFGPLDQPRAPSPGTASAVRTPRVAPAITPKASGAVRRTPVRGEVAVARKTPLTPSGPELHQFLQTGIAGFTSLDETPLAAPAPLDDATVVSIDDLVYRGRAALERAIEVRDEIRLSGRTSDEALAELFDLLDLAATD
ncbi:MAG: Hpt domain protein, partial [Geminicoccaceae bacterium]|nr:Hpt domain protein [Geminicoccaceae bacterium]